MKKLHVAYGAAAVVVVALGTFSAMQFQKPGDRFAQCRKTTMVGGTMGGPFTLIDSKGKTITSKELITKPVLLYFGYSSCADVCPIDNARNAAVADDLAKTGHDVTPVFISVDPKRDTPKVMGEYAANLSPRMVGLTGTPAEVKAAAKAYKVFYSIPDPQDKFYTVNHTSFTYLVLPKYGFLDMYPHTATEKEMVKSVSCYLDKAGT